jgi:3-hydroxyacyl-CoA dehydrogenase/enoyl-CoA hydratase/3-hydroxybutyryl-CoA epimerase
MVMLDEKIDKSVIDAAAKKFGMPMGPIELADQVGLDICLDCRRHAALEIRRRPAADAGRGCAKKSPRVSSAASPARDFTVWKDGKGGHLVGAASPPRSHRPK